MPAPKRNNKGQFVAGSGKKKSSSGRGLRLPGQGSTNGGFAPFLIPIAAALASGLAGAIGSKTGAMGMDWIKKKIMGNGIKRIMVLSHGDAARWKAGLPVAGAGAYKYVVGLAPEQARIMRQHAVGR